MNKQIKLAIAVPLTFDSIPIQFFESFVAMKKPFQHIFIHAGGYRGIDHIRNQLVDAAKKYDCTHILFLDVDHRHNPDTIVKLISHNKQIVSGLSYRRVPPFEVCAFNGQINAYKEIVDWEDGSLIEVDSVGAACLLIDMEVFNNIEKPYFMFMENPDPNSKFGIGEDVVFCNRVKQAGYKIYVDTSCTNKHLATVEIDGEVSTIWKRGEKGYL